MSRDDRFPSRFPSSDELLEIARLAVQVAARQGSRMAVCGGLAMQLYGSPRLTKDVDVVADGPPGAAPEWTIGSPLSFGGFVLETTEGLEVEWIDRTDDYRSLYANALEMATDRGQGVPVVSPEHLAAMKLATLRPKDYEDLMFLLGKPGLVDTGRARAIVYEQLGGKFAADQFDAAVEGRAGGPRGGSRGGTPLARNRRQNRVRAATIRPLVSTRRRG